MIMGHTVTISHFEAISNMALGLRDPILRIVDSIPLNSFSETQGISPHITGPETMIIRS